MAMLSPDPFDSSMIEDASYDDESGELTVIIHGDEYVSQITPDQWASFNVAPSKGRWYRQNIEEKAW